MEWFFAPMFACISVVGAAAAFIFWIWLLIDCATKEPSHGNEKIVWIIIIALFPFLGALLYFFVRRPIRIRQHGR
jgi:hypothetical protein